MATKPGDDEKTPLWRKILAGVGVLVTAAVGLAAAVAGWEAGKKDDDDDEDDEDDEDEDEDA